MGERVVVAIDDDVRVRESIESLLGSAGYTPLMFSSAEECLESGALSSAACLITDVRLPGISGIELQRQIRLELLQVPVILISAHHDDEVRKMAIEEGAVTFLYKPFDAADLFKAIDAAFKVTSDGSTISGAPGVQ